MDMSVRVLIWTETAGTPADADSAEVYPDGMETVLAQALTQRGFDVETACLADSEHGLSEARLGATDVLIWWGHREHDAVSDDVVRRVQRRVLDGMGFIALHSSHLAKPFLTLLGTGGTLRHRLAGKDGTPMSERGETERLWLVAPGHPIAEGVSDQIELPQEEMYGEPFDIPEPDELVFISWFEGGEVFRSGCCWRRGRGRIFYFRPGHETFATYWSGEIQHILANAVRWAAPPHQTGNLLRTERAPYPPSPLKR
jgi:trehalose utilization protein